jgi:hypothetical protein
LEKQYYPETKPKILQSNIQKSPKTKKSGYVNSGGQRDADIFGIKELIIRYGFVVPSILFSRFGICRLLTDKIKTIFYRPNGFHA